MELLLYKDLIIDFVSKKIKAGEHQRLINKIFENENSLFLYSKKFFQFIEAELGEEYADEFRAIVTKIGDSGENIKSSELATNFDEEFLHIYQNFDKYVLLSISYSEPSKSILQKVPNIGILSERKKPNYHWLVTQIAVLHPNKVSVDCFDFKSNNEIKKFFDDVFRIPKSISRMHIFDRETCNFGHKHFDSFKKSVSVFYYTYRHKNFSLDEPIIKSAFRKIKIHTTHNRTDIHNRKLVFEGFVLTANHAFNELLVDGDWDIDIQFSKSEAVKWMSRCNKFR